MGCTCLKCTPLVLSDIPNTKKAPRLDYFQARRFFCSLYALSAAAILRRRHAGVFLEVFAEERLVGEVQFLRNLLDAFLRVA